MLKIILCVLAIAFIGLLIVIAMRPAEFRTSRSTVIAASPAVIFAQVNNLHSWESWSPWAKLDLNSKSTFEGPDAGVGAAMTWEGNNEVGAGKMTITESHPSDLVRLRLDFLKPMAATNVAEFTFGPQGNGTVVTWTMSGHNNFLAKAFGLFVDCDKMIGGYFEKGLASLKAVAEAAPKS